jgi:exodeoxyribonuclease VIII
MNSGFYENVPFAEYVQIEAYNFSSLKHLARSPLSYRYHRDNEKPPTAAMILGSAVHLAILQPHLAKFAVWPGPGIRSGSAYKDWCMANKGLLQLTQAEFEDVKGISRAVHANVDAHKYLRIGKRELTMVWRSMKYKRLCKARIDNLVELDDEPILVSLKSTVDCHERKFGQQYHTFSYHAQDALYSDGYFTLTGQLPKMVTVAVDNKAPYETCVYRIPEDVLMQGDRILDGWMATLDKCEKTNTWPIASEGEVTLSLPAYAYEEFDMSDLEPIER